ncbi:MAG: tripartite tricarboxylate transporter substrate binding protein [Pigmentiphaga sp.]|nr:tripartite tricarboxylate transporter substrate binding protein [Pigmentiphaga sp.]
MNHKTWLSGLALILTTTVGSLAAAAPLSLIVPFPPGGPADASARMLQPGLSETLQDVVVVENYGGAGGSIGTARMLAQPADGQTTLLATVAEPILAPLVLQGVKYDPSDLRLISPLSHSELALVARADFPIDTIEALVEAARGEPGTFTYATPGNGSLFHLVGEHFEMLTDTELVHVPYRGFAPAINDLLGRQVDLSFVPLAGNVLDLAKSGKIKVIGTLGKSAPPGLPGTPTLRTFEPLADFGHTVWTGIFVRQDMPAELQQRLHRAVDVAIRTAKFQDFIRETGGIPLPQADSLEDSQAFYEAETGKLQDIARRIGLQPE